MQWKPYFQHSSSTAWVTLWKTPVTVPVELLLARRLIGFVMIMLKYGTTKRFAPTRATNFQLY